MIQSVVVTNHLGEYITLELARPEKSGLAIRSIDGLGPAKASVNTMEYGSSDGDVYSSSRLQKRNITFDLMFDGRKEGYTIESIRQMTYRYFPIRRHVNLEFRTDNRTLTTEGWIESNTPDIFSQEEGCQISVICPDPIMYSAETQRTRFFGSEPQFEFANYTKISGQISPTPTDWLENAGDDAYDEGVQKTVTYDEIIKDLVPGGPQPHDYFPGIPGQPGLGPSWKIGETRTATLEDRKFLIDIAEASGIAEMKAIEFGSSAMNTEAVLTYEGDIEVGMEIRIDCFGDIGDIAISNLTLGQGMLILADQIQLLTGNHLTNGDSLIINTMRGHKSIQLIREGYSYNVLNILGSNPTWLQLAKGDNRIMYSATAGYNKLGLTIDNKIAYEGV